MIVKIASVRGIDKFAKKSQWATGFSVCNDNFTRLKSTNDITNEIDCFVQFNIYNPYRQLKQEKIDAYKKIIETKKPFIVWEEGCFRKYTQYKRVGWNHYQNSLAEFNLSNIDDSRWNKFVKNTELVIKDWKSPGDNILIMGQLEYDSALIPMYDKNIKSFYDWLILTITDIRKFTDRPIVFRPHPFDYDRYIKLETHLKSLFQNVEVSRNFSKSNSTISSGGLGLEKDLSSAYCVVTFNSNSGIESICNGIPTFALDQTSPIYQISQTDLSQINSLNYNIDITRWCNEIAFTLWESEEIKKGETWGHLKPVFFK